MLSAPHALRLIRRDLLVVVPAQVQHAVDDEPHELFARGDAELLGLLESLQMSPA